MMIAAEEVTNVENNGEEPPSKNYAVLIVARAENEPSDAAVAVVATSLDENLEDSNDIPLAPTEMLPEAIDELPSSESQGSVAHRPAIISATVLKRERNADDTGLSLEKVDEGLRISSIDPGGLFGETSLCEGDYVLSVNNTSCEDRRVAYVSRLIRRSKEAVTLVVRRIDGDPFIVSTMVTKPTPDSRVGIGVQCVDGSLCVSSICPSGLFAGGIVNVGNKVVSIGGVPCPCMDSASAIELIRKETNTVTIVTWTEAEAGIVVGTRHVSLGGSFLDLLWLWRWNILIISITFTIIAVIAAIVSQTGHTPACKDLGQRPLPVARECP